MSYISPVEVITTQMRMTYEEEIINAVHDVGILVEKEELEKALKYDRDQYSKGFSDGIDRVLEIVDEIERDTGHVALIGDDNKFAGVLCNSREFRDRVLALKGGDKHGKE